MDALLWIVMGILLATLVVGLARTVIGPSDTDRIASALLLSTNGVAILVVAAALLDLPAARDAALVFAALGAIIAVAFSAAHGEVSAGSQEER